MLNLRKIIRNNNVVFAPVLLVIVAFLLVSCGTPVDVSPTTVGPAPTLPEQSPTIPPTDQTTPPTQPATEPAQPSNTPILKADSLPDAGNYTWALVVNGLRAPLYLTHAGDDSGRVFILEKPGRIQIVQEDSLLAEPFLDIRGRINSQNSERGLLGLAFHPDYTENGFFYVNYTDLNGNTVVSRFQVTNDPNRADPDSESILLQFNQPYANHNGGMLAFGPDGYLYVGTGDGGSGGDPQGNAQNPNTLLGKILRLDVDSQSPYANPPDNAVGGLPEIWALGLRNPWRFSFDRTTGDLWIGDVGQNQWEEINMLPAGIAGGLNLGWDYYEGTHSFDGTPPDGVNFVVPVMEYAHGGGDCSVTGGYVYRGQVLDEWQGVYLFGDYCSGTVWGALPDASGSWQSEELFQVSVLLASFGEDQDGELYLVDLNGAVYKLAEK